jgi:hypothetical protein
MMSVDLMVVDGTVDLDFATFCCFERDLAALIKLTRVENGHQSSVHLRKCGSFLDLQGILATKT